jgi:glycosyltransferase involved in cell wall biosynthesis
MIQERWKPVPPMCFHVVGLPHTQVVREFNMCAFTENVRKFCIMMKVLQHKVFLYAGERTDAPCDELVTCISEEERLACLDGKSYVFGSFDANLPHWHKFNIRAAAEIEKRAQERDFVCLIGGVAHKPIADDLPEMTAVEFGVGYGGTFAKYRVFESYAWMHTVYGAQGGPNPTNVDGQWCDAVIPGHFEAERFPFRADKDNYFLYVGRMIDRKGIHVAAEVCESLGVRLIIAGEGEARPKYGEVIGAVGPEFRNELLAGARALFCPTLYIEPFGNVAVEAMLCGTPVISTDWGAFTETNIDGVTGFRCRTRAEFQFAAAHVDVLDRKSIREYAVRQFSLEAAASQYERFFRRISELTKSW